MREQLHSKVRKGHQSPLQENGLDAADEDIDFFALLLTIWRGKWFVAIVCSVFLGLGAYYLFSLAIPHYTATSVVILDTDQNQVAGLQSISQGLTGDEAEINSEVEVLRARGLLGKVVDKLDLVNDPEFNPDLRQASPIREFAEEIIWKVKAAISGDALRVEVPTSPERQARRARDTAVSLLFDSVSVENIRKTHVFRVTVEAWRPEKAMRIADTIVQEYILNQIEVKFDATEQATKWLSDRVGALQLELETTEKRVSDFSADTELVSEEALQIRERQIKDMRERIKNTQEALTGLQAQLRSLEGSQTRQQRAALAQDSTLSRLARRLDQGADVERLFDEQFAAHIADQELETARLTNQLSALVQSEADLAAQIEAQGQDLITLQQLRREAEATRVLYEHFLTRLKETSAQQGIQKADSRLLSSAIEPYFPSSPNIVIGFVIWFLAGLSLSAGILLFREWRNDSFRTVGQLETHTGYSVLGQIPSFPDRRRHKILEYLTNEPTSAAAEAVRNLRTSVMMSNVDKPPQLLVVTSSIPSEGKTTSSIALAHNLQGLDQKVLLIEGDIRRRSFKRYFPELPDRGLVSVLAGNATHEEVVYRPEGFGGDILAADKSTINAADLYSSKAFKEFVTEMRSRYDMIVIDTPPVMVVPDARIIAQVADAVLFTVKWDSTSRAQVDEALRIFEQSNQRVTGLVFNNISERGMQKYGYGGRYGTYGSYRMKYYGR